MVTYRCPKRISRKTKGRGRRLFGDIISNYSSTEINSPNYHLRSLVQQDAPCRTRKEPKNNGTDNNTIKKAIRELFVGVGERESGTLPPKTNSTEINSPNYHSRSLVQQDASCRTRNEPKNNGTDNTIKKGIRELFVGVGKRESGTLPPKTK
ncbi:hypothetical protein CEXT_96791 [Caerostris extrusa]|uniref:Uncharacterized protein n=1 Tax=Caerostris extrusa TaxID=172846 RepID=A0AAV4NPW5_CAEEX|nr:hypothetical protein CEXT_96791 [Caerostris extrusa]